MAIISERDIMNGAPPEEQTAKVAPSEEFQTDRENTDEKAPVEPTAQATLFEKFLAEREQVWRDTSLPYDIFDMSTGYIKRNNGSIDRGTQHLPVLTSTDIHNFAADEVERELEVTRPTYVLTPRRPLTVAKQVAASLLTSLTG